MSASAPQTSLRLAATLNLFGRPPLNCDLRAVRGDKLDVQLIGTTTDSIAVGELAQLQADTGATSLTLRAQVYARGGKRLTLELLSGQEAALEQLLSSAHGSAPPASDNVTPIALSAKLRPRLQRELADIAVRHVTRSLEGFFDNAETRLFDLAEHARSNLHQSRLFELMTLFRHQRTTLIETTAKQLRQRAEQGWPSAQTDTTQDHTAMELVDLEEFEDWLSLENIVRSANKTYYHALEALIQRYRVLLEQPMDSDSLPIGIASICHAFQHALRQHAISAELLPVVYQLFDERVVRELGDLYETLNARLKQAGVLPGYESEYQQPAKPPSPADGPPAPSADDGDRGPSGFTPERGEALYATVHSIMDLLSERRGDQPASEAGAGTLDVDAVVGELSDLQQQANAAEAIRDAGSLGRWLEAFIAAGGDEAARLSPAVTELIALVDGIFQQIETNEYLAGTLSSKLLQLQAPLAKVALLDGDFFRAPEHPARLLINRMVELCLGSELPNPVLEKKLGALIDHIVADFDTDLLVFEHALTELALLRDQQSRARQRNTELIAKTYEGRQQLKRARAAVEKELLRRVPDATAPVVIVDLVEQGWRELLTLTYLKAGPESAGWQEQLSILEQLMLWLQEPPAEDDGEHSELLMERKLEAEAYADLIGQQLENVFPGEYKHQALVERIRSVLNGEQAVQWRPSPWAGAGAEGGSDLMQELEAAHPHLTRWFKRARGFRVGEQFNYLGDKADHQPLTLAWISDDNRHFVFVNHRGQKVFDFDILDLANELAGGLQPSVADQQWPLVEQSLFDTMQDVYQQLTLKSTHDELTGLCNRKEFERLLTNALSEAKNSQRQHTLLYVDIDQFSVANNLYGHIAGDALLAEVARLIIATLPNGSVIGRLGGNEFGAVLYNIHNNAARQIADQLRGTVHTHAFQWEEHSVEMTVSIGMVQVNRFTDNVVNLLRNAVSACSAAKEGGRNRVHDFRQDAELHSRREKLLGWIDRLSHVLGGDMLVLRGQQICDLRETEGTPHYEILLSLRGEDGQLLSPSEFIEAAECYNRMQRVDRWVIEKTFRWLDALARAAYTVPYVSINLSGNSINDAGFMDFLLEQFGRYAVPTERVCFEVTETATIHNIANAADFMREIRKIGCRFSLDDFGTGHSSYEYLKHLPVDFLKIDGMFVRDIDWSRDDYAMVKSINEIAHLMGKQTVAEYAENDRVVAVLKEIGIDFAQGYATGRPQPLDTFYPDLNLEDDRAGQ